MRAVGARINFSQGDKFAAPAALAGLGPRSLASPTPGRRRRLLEILRYLNRCRAKLRRRRRRPLCVRRRPAAGR